jgi:hypothetical protein
MYGLYKKKAVGVNIEVAIKAWLDVTGEQLFFNTLNSVRKVNKSGAQERTRTSTGFLPLAPEASVYTNFTTWAFFKINSKIDKKN